MTTDPETYTEWRVSGILHDGGRPYSTTWSGHRYGAQAEWMALGFLDYATASKAHTWLEGPHLYSRTVTVTPWERVPDPYNTGHAD